MKKPFSIMIAVFMAAIVAIYLFSLSTIGSAAQSGDNPLQGKPERATQAGDLPVLNVDDLPADRLPNTLRAQQDGRVQVMVELERRPAALVYADSLSQDRAPQAVDAVQAQLAAIEASQEALLPALRELDATILYRTQRVFNGIAIMVDASRMAEIRRLPGVKAVQMLVPVEPDHTTSVPLIGAPELWEPSGLGLTGSGIKIGVIDSGVDYLHANFGGDGGTTPSLYTTNDTTIVGDVPGFPGAKVVGGYDFAGDNYDASGDSGSPIPSPDPDPMDCDGHGSHVAGSSAGYGVNDDGSTYTGSYTKTMPLSDFRIGPGVAPEAEIYALRVFGCEGSTSSVVIAQAIEWAVDPNGDGDFSDRLDVINMSLGAAYGSPDGPFAVASNNAAAAGVVVVASAGNNEDVYYITGSPGVGERVLSVAASADESSIMSGFRVNTGALTGVHPASQGSAFDWTGFTALTSTLTYPADQSSGCDEFSPANKAMISGTITLLNWTEGECGSSTRGDNLENANAVGMLLADNSDFFDLSIFGSDEIPSYSIPREIGEALSNTLDSEGTISLTLTSAYDNSIVYRQPAFVDTVAEFTSRGPRRDNRLKPDVTAPGVTVFSTGALTGDEGASFNGTSMSAPHAAGVMALLRQQHPFWSVEELKALAMNTALHNVRVDDDLTSAEVGPGRIGAGRIDAGNAGTSDAVAYNPGRPGAVSVSFGELEVLNSTTVTRMVRVVNNGGDTLTFEPSYDAMADIPGVEYHIPSGPISVAPHSATELTISMTADPATMSHTHDPSIHTAPLGIPRSWISEEAGYLRLMPETTTFAADPLSGDNQPTPVTTSATGTAVFTYTASTGDLDYTLDVSDIVSPTMAHIHLGLPGVNGGVLLWLYDASGTNGPSGPFPVSGTLNPSEQQLLWMLSGSTYVNVHTEGNPAGEIRGQIELSSAAPLRVPLYATARPAADMEAVQSSIDIGATTAISLSGQELDTGSSYPTDTLSLVTALELQGTSPNEAGSSGMANNADLAYIGASSDVGAGSYVTESIISFGIATHGDWASASAFEAEFDIYIDVDQDGGSDYVLLNWDLSPLGYSGDTFYTYLVDLSAGVLIPQFYLNGAAPTLNTYQHNSNVMVLPVAAEDLGLSNGDATFDFYVVSFSRDASGVVDFSDVMTYDAENPGLDFSGGFPGVPVWPDLDGGTISLDGDLSAYLANGSQGALLLHHHNAAGARAEVIDVNIPETYLPIIFKP